MTSKLILDDGTEFTIEVAKSGRPVLVGFDDRGLEKIVRLIPSSIVISREVALTYGTFIETIGRFVAYFPDPADYKRVAKDL